MKKVLPYLQWCMIGLLITAAVYNSVTDHGVMMAVNCFCLGVVAASMVVGRFLDRKIKEMDLIHASMTEAANRFTQAVVEGRIELIAIAPDSDPNQKTLH